MNSARTILPQTVEVAAAQFAQTTLLRQTADLSVQTYRRPAVAGVAAVRTVLLLAAVAVDSFGRRDHRTAGAVAVSVRTSRLSEAASRASRRGRRRTVADRRTVAGRRRVTLLSRWVRCKEGGFAEENHWGWGRRDSKSGSRSDRGRENRLCRCHYRGWCESSLSAPLSRAESRVSRRVVSRLPLPLLYTSQALRYPNNQLSNPRHCKCGGNGNFHETSKPRISKQPTPPGDWLSTSHHSS